jgi:FtsZ-binding cell division protein ZapB
MTKRFKYVLGEGFTDYGKPLTASQMVNKTNELHKKYIDEYSVRETLQLEVQRLEEENKQLHNENTTLKKRVMIFQDKIRGLMK